MKWTREDTLSLILKSASQDCDYRKRQQPHTAKLKQFLGLESPLLISFQGVNISTYHKHQRKGEDGQQNHSYATCDD